MRSWMEIVASVCRARQGAVRVGMIFRRARQGADLRTCARGLTLAAGYRFEVPRPDGRG
jgi:hypothetical protein